MQTGGFMPKLPSAIKEEHLWVKLHLPVVC